MGMQIALLQTATVWENKQVNTARCAELIAALPAAVRLVALPEMFATGFSMCPEMLAEPEQGGATLQWMRNMAMQHGKAITGSVIIKDTSLLGGRGAAFYNRLYFVFPNGTYKKYDKRHLFAMGEEHAHYSAGCERLIVEFEGWRICPLVCYDLRFPAFSRNIDFKIPKFQDFSTTEPVYDLLLYVASWPTARIDVWDTLLAARAIENQCYAAGVNRCGADNAGTAHAGHSQALDFKGVQLVRAKDDTEDTVIAALSLDELRAFRTKFPVWRDADSFSLATNYCN